MKTKLDEKKVTLVTGLAFATYHFTCVVLIQVFGQSLLNSMQLMHFISPISTAVLPFDVVTLVVGVLGAFVVGAGAGGVFAVIWNRIGK